MENQAPIIRNGGIFSRASLDLQFARTRTLDPRVTHTRQSSATYVDGDGVIRTAVTNLLLRSEDLTLSPWSSNFSGAGVTATNETYTAPDGSTTVTKLTFNQQYGVRQQDANTSDGTSYTFSGYVKRLSGPTEYYFLHWNSASGNSSGGLTVTDQWTRFEITVLGKSGGGNVAFGIQTIATSDFGELLVWGAQVEQSSTVGQYVKTTTAINSAPRFDHDPATGESLGLLVEESRANLLLYSACNSNWTTAGFGTATYDLGLSALGIFSGVSVGSLGQVWHTLYRSGISLTASTVYAFTLFYRAGTSGRCRLVFRNNTTATETIINGVAGNLSVNGAFAGAATVLSQYLCSDGLTYVVTGTFTPNGTSADYWFRIGPDSGTSGQTVIALGGQLEAGSFPTSYIPTEGSQVTRAADVASITGTNFSSWYNDSEGTIYAEGGPSVPNINKTQLLVTANDNSSNNRWYLGKKYDSATVAEFGVTSGGDGQAFVLSAPSSIVNAKYAAGYRVDSFGFITSGGALGVDTSGLVPSGIDRLLIGTLDSASNNINGTISRLTYWPTRLSDDTLQTITT